MAKFKAAIDEAALIELLKTTKIGEAGLDVFEMEPLPRNSLLRELHNVILTLHTAGRPDGLKFHHKRCEFFVENIRRVSEHRTPINPLNQILNRLFHDVGLFDST